MNFKSLAFSTLALSAIFAFAGDPPGSAPAMPPMAKPVPQHDTLKSWVGTWDGVVRMWMAPGQPPMESKGVMTSRMMGDFWLLSDWTGEFMNQPFLGHQSCGYHIGEKRFVCYWADSSADFSMAMKGIASADGKAITYRGRAPGMDGKTMANWKAVYDFGDSDRHVYTMWIGGKKGGWVRIMEIIYSRRK